MPNSSTSFYSLKGGIVSVAQNMKYKKRLKLVEMRNLQHLNLHSSLPQCSLFYVYCKLLYFQTLFFFFFNFIILCIHFVLFIFFINKTHNYNFCECLFILGMKKSVNCTVNNVKIVYNYLQNTKTSKNVVCTGGSLYSNSL